MRRNKGGKERSLDSKREIDSRRARVCNDGSLILPFVSPDEILPTRALEPSFPSHCETISFSLFSRPPLYPLSPFRSLHPFPHFVSSPSAGVFVPRSISFRSSPTRCSTPHLGDSCLNAQTKRQIKGTAGRVRTAREWVKRERERKRGKGRREWAFIIIIVRIRVALSRRRSFSISNSHSRD